MLKDIPKASARPRPATRLVQSQPIPNTALSGKDRKADRRAEDIKATKDWLGSGAPIGDVLTMLEVRHRFDPCHSDCRAYAVEILWAAQGQSRPEAVPTSTPKESRHAAA